MAPTDTSDSWFFVSTNELDQHQEAAERKAKRSGCLPHHLVPHSPVASLAASTPAEP